MAAGGPVRIRISGDIAATWNVEARWAVVVPLLTSRVSCGFPSPADDYLDPPLDFNELLIGNPSSTMVIRVVGDSMEPVLMHNDYAVVDKSLAVRDGVIIWACLNGEFTIKRYRNKGGRCWLQPENPAYAPIVLTEESNFQVEGVVWWSLSPLLP